MSSSILVFVYDFHFFFCDSILTPMTLGAIFVSTSIWASIRASTSSTTSSTTSTSISTSISTSTPNPTPKPTRKKKRRLWIQLRHQFQFQHQFHLRLQFQHQFQPKTEKTQQQFGSPRKKTVDTGNTHLAFRSENVRQKAKTNRIFAGIKWKGSDDNVNKLRCNKNIGADNHHRAFVVSLFGVCWWFICQSAAAPAPASSYISFRSNGLLSYWANRVKIVGFFFIISFTQSKTYVAPHRYLWSAIKLTHEKKKKKQEINNETYVRAPKVNNFNYKFD